MADIGILLTKLNARTLQGKVAWQASASEQTFFAIFGNVSVMVSRQGHVRLRILDKTGREIYELDGGSSKELQQSLKILHESARYVALGVDRHLEELLAELDKV